MSLIELELGSALNSAVKRKANTTLKLRSEAKRIAGGSAEVMVKVTGFGKGAGHVKAHLDYISRNGKLELENDRGEIFTGKDEIKEFFKDWEGQFGDGKRYKNQRDTMHMVLSMPETTDPESVKSAVREFAKTTFSKNHEYVFALHTDEPHPHCHVTVKCLGFDGKRLNPRKADLQHWREEFAEKLRDQGVDAEASPRRSRGVTKKAEPNVIRHIERGDESHEPRVSQVRAAKTKEAADEIIAEQKGLPIPSRPWEDAVKAKQSEIRRAWLAAAEALEQEQTKKTFNQKEARNERPDYDRITSDRARPGQRAAAVYQSNLERSRRKSAPGTIASVRNLSRSGMVQHERASKMFLQSNAFNSLGNGRGTNTEMRRSGAGASSAHGEEKRLNGYQGTAAENKALAARIRAFVQSMPVVETERQQVKNSLVKQFTQSIESKQNNAPIVQTNRNDGRKNGADKAAPEHRSNDIDR